MAHLAKCLAVVHGDQGLDGHGGSPAIAIHVSEKQEIFGRAGLLN